MRQQRRWDYQSPEGTLLGYVVRWETETGKEIRPHFKPDGAGGFAAGGPSKPSPLFGLDYLAMGTDGDPVLIVEGEKAAAALHNLGVIAVTSQGGANAADKADWAPLAGLSTVYMLPDNDDAGERYISDVFAALSALPISPEVKVLRLPGLGVGGDIVDWIAARTPDWDSYGPIPESLASGVQCELLGLLADSETFKPPHASVGEWPEPIPLDERKLPRWPECILPAPLESFISEISAVTETPKELGALTALGIVAASAQLTYRLHVRPGHWEPLCLWTCVALPSGSRKTAVHDVAKAPFVEWEAKRREALEPVRRRALSEIETINDRLKALRKKAATAKESEVFERLKKQAADLELTLPALPPEPHLWTSDVTPENLAVIMSENNEAVSIVSDEGGIFETMAGRYNNGNPNLDIFLQAHTGSAVRVNRSSKPPVNLKRPVLSFVLAPQPDVIRSLASKPGFKGRGLLARLLFALPPSNLGHRPHLEENRREPNVSAYNHCIERLLNRIPTNGEPLEVTELSLSREAAALLSDYARKQEPEMAEGGRYHVINDWLSKRPGAAARIAALLHLTANEPGPTVGAKWLQAALQIMDVLAEHALAAFDEMNAVPEYEQARKVAGWIRRNGLSEFRRRDCFDAHKHQFKRVDNMTPALGLLMDSHIIRPLERKQVAYRPSVEYEVNPLFLAA